MNQLNNFSQEIQTPSVSFRQLFLTIPTKQSQPTAAFDYLIFVCITLPDIVAEEVKLYLCAATGARCTMWARACCSGAARVSTSH